MYDGIKGSAMTLLSRRNNYRVLLFALLLVARVSIQAPSSSLAGQVITIDADQQYEYADKALHDGEFDRAVIEYRRFLDFFPKDERARKARFQIGSAYYEAKRFNDAITAFQVVIQTKPVDEFSIKSYQTISECYLKLGQTKQAVSILKLQDRFIDTGY